MNFNTIQNIDVKNKKVLLRVDFNVEIENGKAKENFKIAAGNGTVQYLLEQGAKVALISHLGRPDGKVNAEFSLEQLTDDAEQLLGVKVNFIADCVGEKVKNGLEELIEGEVLLLENVRFYPGEETNDLKFSELLAENFDIFVNDAFSVCHRDQASVTGVAKIIPSAAGFWLQKEITNLEKVKNNPEHPAVAIIGGAKIETKLPLIAEFEKNYDAILVGGRIANEAIDIVGKITVLRENDMQKIQKLGTRASESAAMILPNLYGQPIVNASTIQKWTGFTRAGAQRVIDRFVDMKILEPKDKDVKYGQSYVYKKYLGIFHNNK
jgi:phosphoglycerate kinase